MALSASLSFSLSHSLVFSLALSLSLSLCCGVRGYLFKVFQKKTRFPFICQDRFFSYVFFVFFFGGIFEGSSRGSFGDFLGFRGPRGGHFGGLFVKSLSFLPERGAPRFCHTLQCFGAIFEVRPSPELKKIEKSAYGKYLFF